MVPQNGDGSPTNGSVELRTVVKRLKNLESRLDDMEREIRLLCVELGDRAEKDRREAVRSLKEQMMDAFQEIPPVKDGEEDGGFLTSIAHRLDEARYRKEDLIDIVLRLAIHQEIQNSRTKLLFLIQKHPISPELFDELDQIEKCVHNAYFSLEEIRLRWRVFEERVSAEMKRIQKG